MSLIILTSATCGPLKLSYNLKANGSLLSNNVIYRAPLSISVLLEHGHYPTGNRLLIQCAIKNQSKDTVVIPSKTIQMRTEGFYFLNLAGDTISNKSTDLTSEILLPPRDSIWLKYEYYNNFRGSFKNFKKQIEYSRLYFTFKGIRVNNNQLEFPDYELVPVFQ